MRGQAEPPSTLFSPVSPLFNPRRCSPRRDLIEFSREQEKATFLGGAVEAVEAESLTCVFFLSLFA